MSRQRSLIQRFFRLVFTSDEIGAKDDIITTRKKKKKKKKNGWKAESLTGRHQFGRVENKKVPIFFQLCLCFRLVLSSDNQGTDRFITVYTLLIITTTVAQYMGYMGCRRDTMKVINIK